MEGSAVWEKRVKDGAVSGCNQYQACSSMRSNERWEGGMDGPTTAQHGKQDTGRWGRQGLHAMPDMRFAMLGLAG